MLRFLPYLLDNILTNSICVQAVHGLRTGRRISSLLVPSPAFCTHFVRSLWLSSRRFTQVILGTYPLLFGRFQSVNSVLYTLPTDLTIKAAF